MTYALIAALILTVVAFVVLLDRKDARTAKMIADKDQRLADEQAAHRREVADVLQRYQLPEVATMRHDVERAVEQVQEPSPPPVTDEDWEREQAEQREWIERMEALENEPFDRVG